ncbi:MAG: hypothetical protein OXE44_09465 [Nitrospinae bacterium]|nr:hypothetical protein [Nitrospinota bacterium]
MKPDLFASTTRGLFLSPESPFTFEGEFTPDPRPVPSNGIALGEVVVAPKNAPIDRLESLEVLRGTQDAWNTGEIKLREKMNVAVAIGGRYANRSISGREPDSPAEPGAVLDLLNVGGVCGIRANPETPCVKIEVKGGVSLRGESAQLSHLPVIPDTRCPVDEEGIPCAPIILVTGSEMDVGKTTCASSLASALHSSGIHVSYVKLTGTGRMRDLMQVNYGRPLGFFDSARLGWDFVDAGLASTCGVPGHRVRRCAQNLLRHACAKAEIVIAELADSPSSDASLHVASDPWVRDWLARRGLLICACDTLESTLIVHWIRSHLGVDEENMLISGRLANEAHAREEAYRMTGIRALSCIAPNPTSLATDNAVGGAIADWVIKHFMRQRKSVF